MAYNNAIPQATDIISVSQSQLLENFAQINTVVGINHQTFGATGEGKHKFLQMPEQGSAPATAVDEAGLYAAVGATSTVAELVFRRENNGAAIAFTEHVAGASGWTMLPSGIMLQWGSGSVAGTSTLNFPRTFPTACYNVQLTSTSGGTEQNFLNIVTGSLTTTGFSAKSYTRSGNSSTSSALFFAIGA
jgi:hypothetical protein